MSGGRPIVAVVLAVALSLGACSDSQDPGVEPADDAPATTSDTLGRCPADGPDATTPPAGCLGPDGQVLTP